MRTLKGRDTIAICLLCIPLAAAAADQETKTLFESVKGKIEARTIEGLLVDNAAGSVSAAALAGVEADAMSVVDNVRDFTVLFGAFDSQSKGFGLAITPARTKFPIPAINLSDYASPGAYGQRLLGALTLSYAQGNIEISGNDYVRRAVSVATSGYLRASDDPIVAVANAKECSRKALDLVSDKPGLTQAKVDRIARLGLLEVERSRGSTSATEEIAAIGLRAKGGDKVAQEEIEVIYKRSLTRRSASGDADAKAELAKLEAREGDGRIDPAEEAPALKAFNDCVADILKKQSEKWNRSRYAISFATGNIKLKDGSGSRESLGRTYALNALYGFDGISYLQDRAAITLTARRSQGEPVLESLATASVEKKNSTLVALRLSGGSSVFRGLIEASNAKASDVTTTQRTMRRAAGIDYRIHDGIWLNFRYGKQRKIDGTGDETGAFMVLNVSPSALLRF